MTMMQSKEEFLTHFDRELATTLRVLRAYPPDKMDLKPHEKSNSAAQVAWIFALECGLGTMVWNDAFAKGVPAGSPPAVPATWDELVAAIETSYTEYRALIAGASEEDLQEKVHFLVAPKTMGEMSRLEFIWFLLFDHIHHRGQLSVYLRMAGGKVPSIYGPTADEPWL